MSHDVSETGLLRRERLEILCKRAESRFKRAMQAKNTRLALRAARFMHVVERRANALAMADVATYSDFT
jgi:hypothetical protein